MLMRINMEMLIFVLEWSGVTMVGGQTECTECMKKPSLQ